MDGDMSLSNLRKWRRSHLEFIIRLIQEKLGENKTGISRGKDKISLLPDHLLCHILSFLTIDEAVSTSVLSSRWRNLWKQVPTLDIDRFAFPNPKSCVDFINKFLNLQSEFVLRDFKLVTGHNNASRYERCLGRVIIKHKIQIFQVDNQLGRRNIKIHLNQSFCENLVCLKLHYARLTDFDQSLSFPCLKIMYLKSVKLPKYEVVIDTPRLEYMTLIDYDFKRFFKIKSMSDSVKVDIDVDVLELMEISQRYIIFNLLSKFSTVGDMTISRRTLQLIYYFQNMNLQPKLRDLTRLRATMFLKVSMKVLPMVLESCPNLKHLTLELVNDDDFLLAMVTKLPTVLSFCLVSSLESVEMESPITEKETVKKLVRYFLDNATSLKKLVLRLNLPHGEKQEPDHFKTLFDSPRRSSVCQFEVITMVQTAKI